jgi:hypothetical protein
MKRLNAFLCGLVLTLGAAACGETDAGVTTMVKAKLAADDTVKAYQIDVDTRDKVVTLSGNVESEAAKTQAARLAGETEGVARVVDNITVTLKPAAFKATMDASQEVPPNDSKGKGTAELTYDSTSKELTWTITFEGLTGPAVAAHFHGPAEPANNAGVAVSIGQNLTSPVTGKATLTDAQAADLTAGRWYVNIHTAANKAGEIRGQVTK